MWLNCVLFGRRVDYLASHVHKGDTVIVSGKLTPREYARKDGTKGFSLDLVCSELELVRHAEIAKNGVDDSDPLADLDEHPF